MNVLYAGTPTNSADILKFLALSKKINIKGVITQNNKIGKRGNKLIESPVAIEAKKHKIPVFMPTDLNENAFKKALNDLDIDILLVVAYGRIIPEWLLKLPKLFPINIHFSLLPKYRGASPIQSSLLMGDKVTGVTYIKMNKSLDSGKIIKQFTCDINPSDNKNTLEKKLTELSINKLIEVLDYIKQDELSFVDQDETKKTYCKKINKEDGLLDFTENSSSIHNKFRAYYGWPGTSFVHNDITIKIHNLKLTNDLSSGKPGSFHKFDASGIYINTGDKVIVITDLQFPNKNIISSKDAFNSYKNFFV